MTYAIKSVELGNGVKLPDAEQGDTRGVPLIGKMAAGLRSGGG